MLLLLYLLPFGHNLNGESSDPQFCGRGECQWVGIHANRKRTHEFPIPLTINFALPATVWSQFQCQVMTPYSIPNLEVRGDLGVENNTNRNLIPTLLFDFYTHYRPNLHCVATIHNAADRESDGSSLPML